MAIPMIAGPSAMASVMLLGSQQPDRMGDWSLALALAWGRDGADPVLGHLPVQGPRPGLPGRDRAADGHAAGRHFGPDAHGRDHGLAQGYPLKSGATPLQ
jgi:hypothetical protein